MKGTVYSNIFTSLEMLAISKQNNIQYTPIINAYFIWFVAFQEHFLSCGTTIKFAQCFCPSVCLSVRITWGQLEWIFVKFAIEEFNNQLLNHINFHFNWTTLASTLPYNQHAFQ